MKDKMTQKGKPLPEGLKLDDLKHNYDIMQSEYQRALTRIKVLDLADRGKIWDIIAQKFPQFQIWRTNN